MLCALTGCDAVFGLGDPAHPDAALDPDAPDALLVDLDEDGTSDDIDSCLASSEDATGDYDIDMMLNGVDACPFNANPLNNTDGDDIPNACDPFPSSPGDRSRCVMTFARTKLANALWLPRTGEIAWTSSPNLLLGLPSATETATVIASTSVEGEGTTTYHAPFRFDAHSRYGSITLWLRADPAAPSAADIGCRYMGDITNERMGVIGPMGLRDPKYQARNAGVNTLRITGSVVTGGTTTTVTCRFDLNGGPVLTSVTSEVLPPGHVGFSAEHWEGRLDGLHVLDHP